MFQAFEVADHDLKVEMANEFRGKVLKCARNQYANHVVQRCMECVPAQDIKFIFRSFCTKAKELSTTAYGCHIIQVGVPYLSFSVQSNNDTHYQ
jgi:pumilio RNA-binding family